MKKKRNYHKYTTEEKEFLKEFAPGHNWQEIIDEFKSRFGIELSVHRLSSLLCEYGVRTNTRDKYPEEEKLFLQEYIPSHTRKETISEYKQRFGKDLSLTRLNNFQQYYHILTDPERGGKKPILSETAAKDGYIYIKVSDKPSKWIKKHRYIWEKTYGKIPEGYQLAFADGNRKNCDLKNLRLIRKSTQAIMNMTCLSKVDGEYFDTAVLIAELKHIQNNRQKDICCL